LSVKLACSEPGSPFVKPPIPFKRRQKRVMGIARAGDETSLHLRPGPCRINVVVGRPAARGWAAAAVALVIHDE
jgi:hypothetical protein